MKYPDKQTSTSFKEKRSEFIGVLIPVTSVKIVSDKLKQLRKTHHSARHVAWAYRLVEDDRLLENSSDDGEPSGSAGIPILGVIRKNEIINAACYVVRYYGGIKLGKRGLIDAYRKSTEFTLAETSFKNWIPTTLIKVESPFKFSGRISRVMEKYGLSVANELSTDTLKWEILIRQEFEEEIIQEMIKNGEGQVTCKKRE